MRTLIPKEPFSDDESETDTGLVCDSETEEVTKDGDGTKDEDNTRDMKEPPK